MERPTRSMDILAFWSVSRCPARLVSGIRRLAISRAWARSGRSAHSPAVARRATFASEVCRSSDAERRCSGDARSSSNKAMPSSSLCGFHVWPSRSTRKYVHKRVSRSASLARATAQHAFSYSGKRGGGLYQRALAIAREWTTLCLLLGVLLRAGHVSGLHWWSAWASRSRTSRTRIGRR